VIYFACQESKGSDNNNLNNEMFFRLIYNIWIHKNEVTYYIILHSTCSFIQVTFDNNTHSYNIYDVIFMVGDLVSIVNAVIL